MAIVATNTRTGTGALNLSTSWTPNAAPSAAMIGGWISTSGTTGALGASFTIGALQFTNAANTTIGATAGATMTLAGASDGTKTYLIDMSSVTAGRYHLLQNAVSGGASGSLDIGGSASTVFDCTGAWSGSSGLTIAKDGVGVWGFGGVNSPSLASAIVLNAGELNLGAAMSAASNTGFGTGKLTANSGRVTTGSLTSVRYLTNAVDVRGNIELSLASVTSGSTVLSGTVDLDTVTRTLTVNGPAIISGAVTGTAGFTKAGAGVLNINTVSPGLVNTVPGSKISVDVGVLNLQSNVAATADVLPNVTAFSVTANLSYLHGLTSSYNINATFSGTGKVLMAGPLGLNAAGAVFTSATALNGLNGVAGITGSGVTARANSGLEIYTDSAGATYYRTSIVTLSDFPSYLTYEANANTANAMVGTVNFTGTGGTWPTAIQLLPLNNLAGSLSLYTPSLRANQSSTSSNFLKLTGGMTQYNLSGSIPFTFGGTNTDNNEFSGVISNGTGTVGITKADAGKWILSGANTYTGTTRVSGGTLSAQNNSAFGSSLSGAVTQTGGTIDISGGVTLNKGTVAANTVGVSGSTALTSTSGNNEWIIGAVAMNSTTIVDIAAGARLKLNNSGALSGVGFGITKNGTGEFELANTDNTFTGAVTVAAGTLTVTKLANSGAGSTSSIGTGAATPAIALTGTLKYIGTGHNTNRSITFTGAAPALDASGSGAVTYSACTTASVTAGGTITFTGTSLAAVNNTFSAALSDGTGAVGVAKTGSNKWVLSGALNHTGTTSCAEGTLNFGSTNRSLTSAIAISGGTIENSTNTLATSGGITMTGGTITAEIASTTAVTVNSGTTARLEPTNSANSYTGATAISTGAVLEVVTDVDPEAPAAGKVLGNSAVTVDGTLTTSANANQRGQMRYGGNLTFNSGAILRIGFAA